MFVFVLVVLMAVGRNALPPHVELGRANASADNGLRPDRIWRDGEAAQRAADVLERDARVDESTQDHVAGGTGKTVEGENGQDPYSIARLCRRVGP